MRVGVDEYSAEAFGLAIGLGSGVGLLAALVRRVRGITWALAGVLMWNFRTRR
jgi:hypothetical protein